jgi:hypothetical protein
MEALRVLRLPGPIVALSGKRAQGAIMNEIFLALKTDPLHPSAGESFK